MNAKQAKQVEKIRKHFLSTYAGREYGLEKDSVAEESFGAVVSVKTGGNVYISEGATICVGPRGGLKLWTAEFATHEGLLKQKLGIVR